jgi:rod shape-determining protein MreD
MARALVFCLLGLLGVLLQGVLLRFGVPDALLPQLVLMIVIYLGFNEISVLGTFVAFVLGLFLDFSSALLVGPWAGAFVTVYGVMAALSSRLFIESPVVAAFISFLASVVASVIYILLGYEYRTLAWEDLSRIVGQALCTAVLAPVVLGVMARRLKKRASPSLSRSFAASVAS